MISQALRLHETSITRHIDEFINKKKLKPENGGYQSYLSTEQTELIVNHLKEKTYRYSCQIVDYIWAICELRFSISGLNKWLHQHGFNFNYAE